jgi:hypothetical protein
MKICLRQFIRPEERLLMDGVGDCTVCKPDEKNKECKMYFPIEISTFEIEELTKK